MNLLQLPRTDESAQGIDLPANACPQPGGKTNILYIIDELCQMGGAERVLLNMVRLLPPESFNVQLVTFRVDATLPIFNEFPCKLHILPLQRTYDTNALGVAWKIGRLIRSERIDIVHTFFETSDLWGGVIAKLSGAPVLISSRRDMGILRSAKHAFAYRLLGRMFDQTQAVSGMVREHFIRQDRLDPAKVITLYNGVDFSKADAPVDRGRVRAEFGLRGASHVVSTLGHVRKVKGLDVFLRSAEVVCRRFPDAVFAIIGKDDEPEHYQQLLELAQQLGIASNVRFIEGVENPTPLLKASDVFCMLSRSEGLSNALLEAMACRLPCVATRVGGNPEVVEEGSSGYIVASEDHAAGGDRIASLLQDPVLARRMGCAGREIVEAKFSEAAMLARLVSEYEFLVSGKG